MYASVLNSIYALSQVQNLETSVEELTSAADGAGQLREQLQVRD